MVYFLFFDDLPTVLEIEIAQDHLSWIHPQGRTTLAFVDDVFVGFESDVNAIPSRLEGKNGTVKLDHS